MHVEIWLNSIAQDWEKLEEYVLDIVSAQFVLSSESATVGDPKSLGAKRPSERSPLQILSNFNYMQT